MSRKTAVVILLLALGLNVVMAGCLSPAQDVSIEDARAPDASSPADLAVAPSTDAPHGEETAPAISHAAHATSVPIVSAGAILAQDGKHPTLAIDEERGRIYVVYSRTVNNSSDVYLRRSDDDGRTFTDAVRVNSIPNDSTTHPEGPAQVRIGPDGEVYVVWGKRIPFEGRRFGLTHLRFARSLDGGASFEPAVDLVRETGPQSQSFHDVAVSDDGTIYVSYLDYRRQTQNATHPVDVRVARSHDRGTTWEETIVDDPTCQCCRTALAVGPQGVVWVIYRAIEDPGAPGETRDHLAARSTDGGRTFQVVGEVHDDAWTYNQCPHAGPAAAVDEQGRVHAIWFTGAAGRAGLHYARSDAAGRYGEAHALVTGEFIPHSVGKIALDGHGEPWIFYEDKSVENETTMRLARGEAASIVIAQGEAPAIAATHGLLALAWMEEGAIRFATATGGALDDGDA